MLKSSHWMDEDYALALYCENQVDSGNQSPIHRELSGLISGKRGIICESVRLEFQELITMCGGPNEKLRAEFFLKFLNNYGFCQGVVSQTGMSLSIVEHRLIGD
ncbi:hypothetical protein SASPL_136520 [Salvia splendens]|uniref:DUF1308 domain-containing protein n=1 Tax=Salvia splendens TaxID=180675 RepID=A0A8X8X1G7_SALSN|nr:hypothetical protein SASPL_136520 [Salvia splendens]